ncbi:MAG: haloacid dehalogenase [Acidobacteria bacterium]|nr:haloacid dehalogenase [Acidobacteriota bacterium]
MESRLLDCRWLAVASCLSILTASAAQASDPLPSWNDGAARQSIVTFVERVTEPGSADFVPPAERIAVFDNDGCLWAEQPMYFQAYFIFDRIQTLAPQHPEWKAKEPFASVLRGDVKGALAAGEHGLLEMAMATHAGTTTEEFDRIVTDWITTARRRHRVHAPLGRARLRHSAGAGRGLQHPDEV